MAGTSGLTISVTEEERETLAELQKHYGGLSYKKLIMKWAHEDRDRLKKKGG